MKAISAREKTENTLLYMENRDIKELNDQIMLFKADTSFVMKFDFSKYKKKENLLERFRLHFPNDRYFITYHHKEIYCVNHLVLTSKEIARLYPRMRKIFKKIEKAANAGEYYIKILDGFLDPITLHLLRFLGYKDFDYLQDKTFLFPKTYISWKEMEKKPIDETTIQEIVQEAISRNK